jgi:hypothetical protein
MERNMEKDEPLLYKLLNMTDASDIKTMSGSAAKKAHAIVRLLTYKVVDIASWLNKHQNLQTFTPLPRKPIQHLNVRVGRVSKFSIHILISR